MEFIRNFYDMDLKRVMKIWYDGNLEAHDFVDSSYWDRNFGFVSRLLPRSEVYVYEIDGYVTGFVGVDEGYIQGLFVDKEYRGQGIGTKLLRYVSELYEKIELDVFENNYGAVCFYENKHFMKIDEQVNEDIGEVEYHMIYLRPKEEEQ
ncbi:MAG: GNAT family N-acetyltransferase [Lachnospiraceae bacterium]|nr:GNAT family N-acetyltransferase [Lachnospiraceae bacterium]